MYLDAAKERITSIPMLINVVSKRVRQLNRGQRPMVKVDSPNMSKMDLALKEIAEGTLTAEMSFDSAAGEAAPGSSETVITL